MRENAIHISLNIYLVIYAYAYAEKELCEY